MKNRDKCFFIHSERFNQLNKFNTNELSKNKQSSWLAWLTIALGVYILTLEPTTSFGIVESLIATAYKLQGPPGAPTYLSSGLFSNFAFGCYQSGIYDKLIICNLQCLYNSIPLLDNYSVW